MISKLLAADFAFSFNSVDSFFKLKKYSKKFILQILLTKNKKNKFLQIKLKKNIVIIDKDKKQKITKNQYANAGYYLVNRNILKFIKNRTCSLENDIFPLLTKKKKISGVTYIGLNKRFIDIGTPADLARVNIFFKNVFKNIFKKTVK